MRMINSQKGQSIFEYIIFLTTVIVVGLVFLGANGVFKRRVESSLNQAVDTLEVMVNKIDY